MSKDKLKNMILENQRINHLRMSMVRITSSVVENKEENNKKNNKRNKTLKNMKSNKSIVAMAIAKGRASVATPEIKRYVGIASCNIVAINPNKALLDAMYNRTSDNEPNYLGEVNIDGVMHKQARIDVFFKLDEKYLNDKGEHIDTIFRKSIFITDAYQTNREGSKVKVVDEYGNTAWVTNEQLANHEIPMYSSGPASITKNYRPLYRNEEVIMNMLKVYLRITPTRIDANGNTMQYNNRTKSWEVVKDASEGLIRFDAPEKFFVGDFKELQEALSYQPNNKAKVLFGIMERDGKSYQDIFDVIISNGTTDYGRLEKEMNDAKANGRYSNTEFRICEFQEYTVTPTSFNTPAPSTDPFSSADDIF